MIKFTTPGTPVAKARPRVTRYATYTPQKTKDYENLVKWSYKSKHKYKLFKCDLRIDITFFMQIPKSTSKKERQAILKENRHHSKRPDIDNLIKSITDALNGLAYEDDNQIVEIEAKKYYSENPRTEVKIIKL